MSNNADLSGNANQLLKIEQVARRLQVSTKTIRRWVASGELIAHLIGRQWRISKADLDLFLRQRRGLK